jgi:hypothetical protein
MSASVDPALPLTVPAALRACGRRRCCRIGSALLPRALRRREGRYAKFMGETFTREYAWYL